jgi:FkbM family methyltransferase
MESIQTAASTVVEKLGRDFWLVRRLRPAYESLLNLVSRRRGIPWVINDVKYRIDPHYRHQLAHFYDPPVAAFLRQRVRAGAVCFDVGANVGVYVLQFAYWSRPNGRVIAFEPNPRARTVLQRHVLLNGFGERVEIVPAAVGEARGEAVLYAAGTDGMSRLGTPNPAIAQQVRPVTVSVTSLDDYCEATGLWPDWLLMDIEGFEIAALAGARRLLNRKSRELEIVMEVHPDAWAAAGTTKRHAETVLADLGRKAIPLTGQRDPLQEHGLVYLAYQ